MFSHCINLENLNLSSFDTINVIYMSEMFWNCDKLKDLDLTSFDTKNVIYSENIYHSDLNIFNEYQSLELIYSKN